MATPGGRGGSCLGVSGTALSGVAFVVSFPITDGPEACGVRDLGLRIGGRGSLWPFTPSPGRAARVCMSVSLFPPLAQPFELVAQVCCRSRLEFNKPCANCHCVESLTWMEEALALWVTPWPSLLSPSRVLLACSLVSLESGAPASHLPSNAGALILHFWSQTSPPFPKGLDLDEQSPAQRWRTLPQPDPNLEFELAERPGVVSVCPTVCCSVCPMREC